MVGQSRTCLVPFTEPRVGRRIPWAESQGEAI